MLKLIIEDDEGRKTVVPFVRDEITIGRQEGNTIRLTERNVSRRHAKLIRQQAKVLVEDLGSYNGIRINGDRITGQVQVADGDLIQIGDYDLAIQNEDAQAAADTSAAKADAATVPLPPQPQPVTKPLRAHAPNVASATSETLPALPTVPALPDDVPEAAAEDITSPAEDAAPRPSNTAVIRADAVQGNRQRQQLDLDASESPRLVVMNTEFAGREFTCNKTELRVGRTDENDFSLDHRSLSRTHCKVVRENNGEWRVIDMQSANGLLVNGEPYAQVTVRHGDVIELGHVKLKFVGPGETYTPEPTIQASSPVSTGGKSKAPFIVLAVLMVAAIGVVGFFTMKSTGGTEVPPPVKPPKKDPVVKADPAPVKDPVPKAADPVEILAQAKAKIAEEDLGAATDLLKPLEASNPEAKTLLNKLQQELSFAAAMMEAETALGEGKIAEAQASLKKAAGTEMQKKRLAGIQAAVTEKAAAKLPTANPVPEKDPTAVAVAPQPTPAEKAVAKYEQALEAIKAAKASGQKDEWKKPLALLDQCIGLDPKNFDCHKKRGVALGKLERPDEAVKAYERFLATAPPSHEDRSTVQQLVTTYKNGSPK